MVSAMAIELSISAEGYEKIYETLELWSKSDLAQAIATNKVQAELKEADYDPSAEDSLNEKYAQEYQKDSHQSLVEEAYRIVVENRTMDSYGHSVYVDSQGVWKVDTDLLLNNNMREAIMLLDSSVTGNNPAAIRQYYDSIELPEAKQAHGPGNSVTLSDRVTKVVFSMNSGSIVLVPNATDEVKREFKEALFEREQVQDAIITALKEKNPDIRFTNEKSGLEI